MNAINGTWKNGHIILDSPTDWPEGCRVFVELLGEEESFGIREEDWPVTSEALEDWQKWYDSLEPLEMTLQEEADLAAWRQKIKEYSIGKMQERMQGLFE
jgi:hypothetical protein